MKIRELTDMVGSGIFIEVQIMSNADELHRCNIRKKKSGVNKMKSTGIVRKVDELGRVVIPIELRRTLGINEKDALEIYVEQDRIILQKYKPNMTCQVTGEISDDNMKLADGKLILSSEGAELLIKEIQASLEMAK